LEKSSRENIQGQILP